MLYRIAYTRPKSAHYLPFTYITASHPKPPSRRIIQPKLDSQPKSPPPLYSYSKHTADTHTTTIPFPLSPPSPPSSPSSPPIYSSQSFIQPHPNPTLMNHPPHLTSTLNPNSTLDLQQQQQQQRPPHNTLNNTPQSKSTPLHSPPPLPGQKLSRQTTEHNPPNTHSSFPSISKIQNSPSMTDSLFSVNLGSCIRLGGSGDVFFTAGGGDGGDDGDDDDTVTDNADSSSNNDNNNAVTSTTSTASPLPRFHY